MSNAFVLSRRRLLTRVAPLTLLGGTTAAVVPAVARGAPAGAAPLPAADGETFTVRRITLYAEKIGIGFGDGLAPGRATVPGPTLTMDEGEQLEVKLVNRTTRTLSLHAHGVDYEVASDGTPMNHGAVKPGASRTSVFRAHPLDRRADGSIRPGSAGYWHYHDHAMGSPHGTDGIRLGLYGALIVRHTGDALPDRRAFVVVMEDMSINRRIAPNTPTFMANVGDRVEWVVITHGNTHHTFHLHGHRWAASRTGTLREPDPNIPLLDNRTTGPGDSFGFQVVAGEGVGPGMWMYHCHVQFHADAGMVGIFMVHGRNGNLPAQALAAERYFRATRPDRHPLPLLPHGRRMVGRPEPGRPAT